MTILLLSLVACASVPDPVVLRGGIVVGVGRADVHVAGGRIVAVGEVSADLPTVDVTGRWLVPAFIDSHVHLAYRPVASDLADGGVAGVVDLGAPESWLAEPIAAPRVLASGPMITAVGGYPTRSWGADGYGLEVRDPDEARAAVDRLHAAGARLIKVPITEPPVLGEATLAAVVEQAHARGLKVGAHALGDAEAAVAAAAGVDVLVHAPLEPLSDATVAAWTGRAVVGTLTAFGTGPTPVDNLRRLREAGAVVLYGTDFGNTTTAGIDPREVRRMAETGMDGAAILASGTSVPAAYWGFLDLGAIEAGKAASLLVLVADPLVDPDAIAVPEAVWIDGRPR